MKVEVKLYVPPIRIHNFNKFWEIASEADIKTYHTLYSRNIELMALVNNITFKWHGSLIARKKIAEKIIYGLRRYYYEEYLPNGILVNRYWMYSTTWEDIQKANFDHYARVIEHMKRKVGQGWSKASYLERWVRHRNHLTFQKVEKNRQEACEKFIKRLEMYGFISGFIEELDPRDIYEQEV